MSLETIIILSSDIESTAAAISDSLNGSSLDLLCRKDLRLSMDVDWLCSEWNS